MQPSDMIHDGEAYMDSSNEALHAAYGHPTHVMAGYVYRVPLASQPAELIGCSAGGAGDIAAPTTTTTTALQTIDGRRATPLLECLTWSRTTIMYYIYNLEQARLQGVTSSKPPTVTCASLAPATPSSTSYGQAEGLLDDTASRETSYGAMPSTPARLARPFIVLRMAKVADTCVVDAAPQAVDDEGCTRGGDEGQGRTCGASGDSADELIAAFEHYFFPHELFASAAGQTGGVAHRSSAQDQAGTSPAAAMEGEQVYEEEATMGSAGGDSLPSPAALRREFRYLLKLGHRAVREAMRAVTTRNAGEAVLPGTPPCRHQRRPPSPPSSSADEAVTHGAPAANDALHFDVLHFFFNLAFNCPCSALAAAAQLLLADGFATVPAPSLSDCFDTLHYLPVLRTQPPRSRKAAEDTSASAAHAVAGRPDAPTRPTTGLLAASHGLCEGLSEFSVEALSSGTLDPVPLEAQRERERLLQVRRRRAHRDLPDLFISEHASVVPDVRATDQLLWCDPAGRVRVMSIGAWLEAQQAAPKPHDTAALLDAGERYEAYFALIPAVTSNLPAIERLLLREDGGLGEQLARRVLAPTHSPGGEHDSQELTLSLDGATRRGVTSSGSRMRRGGPLRRRGTPRTLPVPGDGATSDTTAAQSDESTASRRHTAGAACHRSQSEARRRALLRALAQCSFLLPFQRPSLRRTARETLYVVFSDMSRCPGYHHLLALYPNFLRAHHAAMYSIFFEDGPLPTDVRLMLAIMAASRHRCAYLVSRFAATLLYHYAEQPVDDWFDSITAEERYGGATTTSATAPSQSAPPPSSSLPPLPPGSPSSPQRRRALRERWLCHGPPAHLRVVQRFIAVAAHTPWMLGPEDVQDILRQGWTVPQLFQLVAIIAEVVPLCGLVMGLFLPSEPWTALVLPDTVRAALVRDAHDAPTRAAAAAAQMTAPAVPPPTACYAPEYPGSKESHLPSNQSDVSVSAGRPSGGGASDVVDLYVRYTGEDNIVSERRIRSGASASSQRTLFWSHFNWQEMGSTMMEQYYPNVAALLNEELDSFSDVTRQLTAVDCVGIKSLRPTPSYAFRSLRMYVLNLLGCVLEGYAYNDMNKVLRRPAKWFAQVMTLRPETLVRQAVLRLYWNTTVGPHGQSATSPQESAAVSYCAPRRGEDDEDEALRAMAVQQLQREAEFIIVAEGAAKGKGGGGSQGERVGPLLRRDGALPCSPREMSASASSSTETSPVLIGAGGGHTTAEELASSLRPQSPNETAEETEEERTLEALLALQEEHALLLVAMATMVARKEGLLHLLLYPISIVLDNM